MTLQELRELYKKTNFANTKGKSEWCDGERGKSSIKISEVGPIGDEPAFTHIWISECSYLGETGIESNDYEGSGEDCYFLQELLEYFRLNLQTMPEQNNLIRVPINEKENVLLGIETRK